MILAFFFTAAPLTSAQNEIQNWGVIMSAFALGIASVNLVQVHIKNLSRGTVLDRIYSAVLLVALAGMTILGVSKGQNHPTFQFWFNSVMAPSQSTVWALGAFYIGSSAYRAFRIKNVDSAVLLISAAIVMMGGVPIGEAIWKGFPSLSKWINDIPNMAGMRGMMIGAGIGAIGGGMRMLLGIERSHLGRSE